MYVMLTTSVEWRSYLVVVPEPFSVSQSWGGRVT